MSEAATALTQYGAIGAMLALAIYAIVSLYRDRNAEAAARIADAQRNLEMVTKLQREVLEAVDKLTDLMTVLQEERRDERRVRGGE